MKVKIFVILFLTVLFPLRAQQQGFGLGAMAGQPTGFSAKLWLSEPDALAFGIGYSFTGDEARINLHADYVFHRFDLIGISESGESFTFYYGAGGRLRAQNDKRSNFGIRGVAGLAYLSDSYPFDIFFEAAPVFLFIPATKLDLDFGLGARYFFP